MINDASIVPSGSSIFFRTQNRQKVLPSSKRPIVSFFFCERETELAMNIFMVEYHGNEVNVKISLIFNDW